MNFTVYKQHTPLQSTAPDGTITFRADIRSVGQIRDAKSVAHAFSMARQWAKYPILEEFNVGGGWQ